MRYLYLNLKRFDVPVALGGVNRLAPIEDWGRTVIEGTQAIAAHYQGQARFVHFLPEAHLLNAHQAKTSEALHLGCQGVHREDIQPGGNFGAFTTQRPAAAAIALGCEEVLIGHCEERKALADLLRRGGGTADDKTVSALLRESVLAAQAAGLRVLYAVGEQAGQEEHFEEVLDQQLQEGLKDADLSQVVLAYEPVWAIGPGKTPPGRERIQSVARYLVKTYGLPVVYGGGLKQDNAKMLASIPEISGGLIALTRFSDDFGFYPEEYCEIVKCYLQADGAAQEEVKK